VGTVEGFQGVNEVVADLHPFKKRKIIFKPYP
jgi:hypothetical protein